MPVVATVARAVALAACTSVFAGDIDVAIDAVDDVFADGVGNELCERDVTTAYADGDGETLPLNAGDSHTDNESDVADTSSSTTHAGTVNIILPIHQLKDDARVCNALTVQM